MAPTTHPDPEPGEEGDGSAIKVGGGEIDVGAGWVQGKVLYDLCRVKTLEVELSWCGLFKPLSSTGRKVVDVDRARVTGVE